MYKFNESHWWLFNFEVSVWQSLFDLEVLLCDFSSWWSLAFSCAWTPSCMSSPCFPSGCFWQCFVSSPCHAAVSGRSHNMSIICKETVARPKGLLCNICVQCLKLTLWLSGQVHGKFKKFTASIIFASKNVCILLMPFFFSLLINTKYCSKTTRELSIIDFNRIFKICLYRNEEDVMILASNY